MNVLAVRISAPCNISIVSWLVFHYHVPNRRDRSMLALPAFSPSELLSCGAPPCPRIRNLFWLLHIKLGRFPDTLTMHLAKPTSSTELQIPAQLSLVAIRRLYIFHQTITGLVPFPPPPWPLQGRPLLRTRHCTPTCMASIRLTRSALGYTSRTSKSASSPRPSRSPCATSSQSTAMSST